MFAYPPAATRYVLNTMPEDKQIDQKRADVLKKVAWCARHDQNSFEVPETHLEAARLVAEDSQKVPAVSDDRSFRLEGSTFSW